MNFKNKIALLMAPFRDEFDLYCVGTPDAINDLSQFLEFHTENSHLSILVQRMISQKICGQFVRKKVRAFLPTYYFNHLLKQNGLYITEGDFLDASLFYDPKATIERMPRAPLDVFLSIVEFSRWTDSYGIDKGEAETVIRDTYAQVHPSRSPSL